MSKPTWIPEPSHPPAERLLLSKRDAARLCGIGEGTLHKLVKSGELRSVRMARRVLISVDAIRDFIAKREKREPSQ